LIFDQEKKQYSNFVKIETFKTEATGVHQFVVYYSNSERTRIHTSLIQLKPSMATVEWEVLLHGIPITEDDNLGKEIVVNWEMLDFGGDSTFFTDSNGLEMQKRVLN